MKTGAHVYQNRHLLDVHHGLLPVALHLPHLCAFLHLGQALLQA